jgi:hypothetical protein
MGWTEEEFLWKIKRAWKKTYEFLKADTWQSFFVELILAFLIIKFLFFPFLSFLTGSIMPLVIVESCSMYHSSSMEEIMKNSVYSKFNLTYENSKLWKFQNGLSKGDIILVLGPKNIKIGDIIIFKSSSANPIIHRVVSLSPLETKGDHNSGQLVSGNNPGNVDETNIKQEQLIGKSVFRIPFLGWVKLIFFEPFRSENERGLCR